MEGNEGKEKEATSVRFPLLLIEEWKSYGRKQEIFRRMRRFLFKPISKMNFCFYNAATFVMLSPAFRRGEACMPIQQDGFFTSLFFPKGSPWDRMTVEDF